MEAENFREEERTQLHEEDELEERENLMCFYTFSKVQVNITNGKLLLVVEW